MRNPVFDIMKGIAILLMMVAHCNICPDGLKVVIYSFHMPLFFILSGYFTKSDVEINSGMVKDFYRLIVPYFVTMLFLIAWGGIQSVLKHDWAFVLRYMCETIWMSAGVWSSSWGEIATGPIWFLLALFWGRLGFQILLKHTRFWELWSIGISFVANLVCAKINWGVYVPGFVLQGLGAIQFIAFGYWWRNNNLRGKYVYLMMVVWLLAILIGGIEMYCCYYKCYIIDVLGAIGATVSLYTVLDRVLKVNLIKESIVLRILEWCGRASLVILCMHYFELWSGLWYSISCRIPFELSNYLVVIIRYLMTICMAYLVMKMPILNKVYK